MSKAASLGKAKCQNWLFISQFSTLLYATSWNIWEKKKKKDVLQKCTMQRNIQHALTQTKSLSSPSWPKLAGPVLFTGKGKIVAMATPSDNLLALLELADIWSAVVHKGDHKHILRSECCPLDGTDIKQGSHTFVSFLCSSWSFKRKKKQVLRVKNQHKGFYSHMPLCPLQEVCELKT